MKKNKNWSARTLSAQALGLVDETTRSLVLPIYTSTTYLRDEDNQYRSGNAYSRDDNPTYKPLEQLLSELEQGADALVFGSGMAAAVSVFQALKPGDHVLAPQVMYWSLRNWLLSYATEWGLDVELIDMTCVDTVQQALRPGQTRLVWLETPGNPLWTISDIAAISEHAHRCGARVAVDSTCATPVHSQPLTLGADIVMHSATKYLNGHSDVIAGALITARHDEFWQRIQAVRKQGGAVLSPHDATQLLRGMRTLFIRVREASQSALFLARELQQHPHVSRVWYPGLTDFPGHDLASRQMQGGFGGMLSLQVKGGEQAAIDVAAQTQIWKRATSLGGVESLIEHRASVEGEDSPVPADLLRLSTGIEDPQELLADFSQALNLAHR